MYPAEVRRRAASFLPVAQRRAAEKGLEFSLARDDILAILAKPCLFCGGPGGSVDRFDNTIGYTPKNAVPACLDCNTAKNDMTLDAWVEKARSLVARYDNGEIERVRRGE